MPSLARAQPISLLAGRMPLAALLVASGQWSHQAASQSIVAGKVAVNERIILRPDWRTHPWRDAVTVAGQPLPPLLSCRYLLFFKPYRVLSAWADPEERNTLGTYIPLTGLSEVGRLDYESEGLMLLTDDGWLTHRLTHPHWEHPKTYLVQVEGHPSQEDLEPLRRGMLLRGARTLPAEVEILAPEATPPLPERPTPVQTSTQATRWLRVVLREGAKRQIRHMTAAMGHPALRLVRVAIGPLEVGALQPGQWRELTSLELESLAARLNAQGAAARGGA